MRVHVRVFELIAGVTRTRMEQRLLLAAGADTLRSVGCARIPMVERLQMQRAHPGGGGASLFVVVAQQWRVAATMAARIASAGALPSSWPASLSDACQPSTQASGNQQRLLSLWLLLVQRE